MYHCHIQLCFVGPRRELFAPIKDVPPPEGFTYTYTESAQAEEAPLGSAGLILADLQALGGQALEALLGRKRGDAELIVLAGGLGQIEDIWTLPMGEEVLRFRFAHWQDHHWRDLQARHQERLNDTFAAFLASDVDDV